MESNELIAQIDTEAQASLAQTDAAPETGAAATTEPEPAAEPEPATEPEPAFQQQPLLTEQYRPDTKSVETQFIASRDISPLAEQNRSDTKLSPAVRNLLIEHNLDVTDIPVTGDRLTKEDVLNYLAGTEDRGQKTEDGEQGKYPEGAAQVAAEPVTETGDSRPSW